MSRRVKCTIENVQIPSVITVPDLKFYAERVSLLALNEQVLNSMDLRRAKGTR